MKNKEKYAKEIVEIAKASHNVAVNEGGRLSSDFVVHMLKQIRSAVQKEKKSNGIL